MIHNILKISITILILFMFSFFLKFYTSGYYKNFYITTNEIKIKNIKYKEKYKLELIYIKNYSFKNSEFQAKYIRIKNLYINQQTTKKTLSIHKNKENKLKELKLPLNSFIILSNILNYINIYKTKSIKIENVYFNGKKKIQYILKNNNFINIKLPEKKIIKLKMINNKEFIYSIYNKKIQITINKNDISIKTIQMPISLKLNVKITKTNNIKLTNVQIENDKNIYLSNIFNNLIIKSSKNFSNKNIRTTATTIILNIPLIKYKENILINTKIKYNKIKDIISIKIQKTILNNKILNNITIKVDKKNFLINFKNNKLNGTYNFKKKKKEIKIKTLKYHNIYIKNQIYILDHNKIKNKLFNIIFTKNFKKIEVIPNAALSIFLKRYKTLKPFINQAEKLFLINDFTNFKIEINKLDQKYNFLLKNNKKQIYIYIKQTKNKVNFNIYIKKIKLKDNIYIKNNYINGYFDFKSNLLIITKYNSLLKTNLFQKELFIKDKSYINLENNTILIPNLNNFAFIKYMNNKFEFISNDYINIKTNKKNNLKIKTLYLKYNNNKLLANINIDSFNIKINPIIMNLMKPKIKNKISKKTTKTSNFEYYINIKSDVKNKEKIIIYPKKKLKLNIGKFNILLSNNKKTGNININDGNVTFYKKNYTIKNSNLSIVNDKKIVNFNVEYKDSKVKVNINIFGNTNNNNLYLNINSTPSYGKLQIINYLIFNFSLENNDNNTIKGDILSFGANKLKNLLNIPIDKIKIGNSKNGKNTYEFTKKIGNKIKIEFKKSKSDDVSIKYKIIKNLNLDSYANSKSSGVKLEFNYNY